MSDVTPAPPRQPVTELVTTALEQIGDQTVDELFTVDRRVSHSANAWRGLVGDRLHAAGYLRLRDAPTDEVAALIEPEGMEEIDWMFVGEAVAMTLTLFKRASREG